MNLFNRISGWFGRSGSIGESVGLQNPVPGASLVPDLTGVGVDGALQISTVWACVDRRASTIASLPFFVYQQVNGEKQLARTSRLYVLLHESPNSRMTPFEFWRALVLNHDLRGVGYARIDRDAAGEAIALWPMPTEQVDPHTLDDGTMAYVYRVGSDVAILADENVLVIKNLGNGTTGLNKLAFMQASVDESAKAQGAASKLFGAGGKPTGILMIDKVLNPEQRLRVAASFRGLTEGSTSRLQVLEADMKYQQLSMTPEDQQLLDTRKFAVEEICRWFDVPPVMVHHANVTAWGSGIEQIVDGFYKLTIRPLLVNIEQATRKRVMTSKQRAMYTGEFSLDALLRGSLKDRMAIYAQAVQNGLKTRNECRQLENDPPSPEAFASTLTVQSNLLPIALLGTKVTSGGTGANISQ